VPDVLQVITDTDRRGAQVFAADLHEALDGRLTMRTVALAPGRYPNGLELPVLGASRMGRDTLQALRRQMRQADVTVAHGSTTLPACAIAGLGLAAPFVYRQISDQGFWVDTRAKHLRVTALVRRARMTVALWAGAAETLITRFRIPPGRVRTIPNGVPAVRHGVPTPSQRASARERFGLDPARPVVLSIGALAPEKGVDLVVRAVAREPDWQLLVVGAGPEESGLQELARHSAPGRVRFAGPIDDPVAAFAAADVVALASRGGDSMPAVLIEAGLAQLPSVATPIEGIVEVVLSGRTGELARVEDDASLADGLRLCLERRVAYGRAARQHCLEHFEIQVVAAQWEALLRATAR